MNKTKAQLFIESKQRAWSMSTIKSVSSFLTKYGEGVLSLSPLAFLEKLEADNVTAYSIQTYFIHASNFFEFVNPTAVNVYKEFRKENRNVFKNSYQTKNLPITYQEVIDLLAKQEDSDEKEACLYILKTAQRCSEAGFKRKEEDADEELSPGFIKGKGGKIRADLGDRVSRPRVLYYSVYEYCKGRLGITPHSLRKLALTRAAERGATAADLCEIAGWSSITTAIRYLQPKRAEELKAFLA